ncbi:MAG: hypothetical protein ACAI38_03035 [Myxococcota bacterium]
MRPLRGPAPDAALQLGSKVASQLDAPPLAELVVMDVHRRELEIHDAVHDRLAKMEVGALVPPAAAKSGK